MAGGSTGRARGRRGRAASRAATSASTASRRSALMAAAGRNQASARLDVHLAGLEVGGAQLAQAFGQGDEARAAGSSPALWRGRWRRWR
jgi:hypothetical protein